MFVQSSCYNRSSLRIKCLFKKYGSQVNGKYVLLSCFLWIDYNRGVIFHLQQDHSNGMGNIWKYVFCLSYPTGKVIINYKNLFN